MQMVLSNLVAKMKRLRLKKLVLLLAFFASAIMASLFLVNIEQIGFQMQSINEGAFPYSSLSGEAIDTTMTMPTTTTATATATATTTTTKASPFVNQRIVTTRFSGRLGNLMFEIASSYGIALHNNMSYYVLCNLSEARHIQSVFKQISKFPCIDDTNGFAKHQLPWGNFQPWTLQLGNKNQSVELSGYMQSVKYFWPFRSEIRQLFQFSSSTTATALSVLKNVTNNASDSVIVGVHVRRGDYLSNRSISYGYSLPDGNYFEKTFAFFRAKFPRVVFLVISEDLTWCRQSMNGTDLVFFTSGNPTTDLCIVSKTDHVIMSVGTYSWWSGFLCKGQVLYYRDIARNGSDYSKGFVPDDLFLKEWIAF